jgi:acyl-CoA thioesterase I
MPAAASCWWACEIPPNYGPRYTRAFAGVFREVAERFDVPLVPFILEQVALEPELMQADGIHPTAEAQPLLLDTVWPYLADVLQVPEHAALGEDAAAAAGLAR